MTVPRETKSMFGLVITGGYCNVITVGRDVWAPVYFMHRSGRPVRFVQKVKAEGYKFVPYLDSWPGGRPNSA